MENGLYTQPVMWVIWNWQSVKNVIQCAKLAQTEVLIITALLVFQVRLRPPKDSVYVMQDQTHIMMLNLNHAIK
jgi:hypothetical protein